MASRQELIRMTLPLALLLFIEPGSAQQVGRAPVDVTVPYAPAVATALGRVHLVYELHLTNFASTPIAIGQLEVVAGGTAIATLTAQQLAQRTTVVGQPAVRFDADLQRRLAPGARAISYMWVSLPPGLDAPSSIAHRLTLSAPGDAPTAIATPPLEVHRSAVALSAPVGAGNWVAVRGPSNTSAHRLSIVAASGRATVPQRFAVDWVLLDDEGRMFRGDGSKLADWLGYESPVLAAAPGTVALVRDNAADVAPRSVTTPPTIEASDAPGNVIVIDIGGGRFVSYAHLKSGSARVKPGERIVTGQVLGAIGNSGHSMAPHLHFQVTDAIEPLLGEGLPFVLDRFTLVGRVPSVPALLSGVAWTPTPSQPARSVSAEIPLENMVLRIEGGR